MPNNFFESHLMSVHEEFKSYNWCEVPNYQNNFTTYTDEQYQRVYILKYFAAYFCEYYSAYSKFLDICQIDSIRALSIGCGSGVDFYALKYAIQKYKPNLEFQQHGIDLVDWLHKPKSEKFIFSKKQAAKIKPEDVANVNLYVFPKSLTDIPLDETILLGETIGLHSNLNLIYFVNSYVANNPAENNLVGGVKQFAELCKKLKEYGFEPQSDENGYTYYNNCGLRSIFPFFIYPDSVKTHISHLTENCRNKIKTMPACIKCNAFIWPVLTSAYMAFTVICFKKETAL